MTTRLDQLEEQILHSIRHARMVVSGDRVAVAVSGGADSVALFRMMLAFRQAAGIAVLVAHFNHTLRGAESEADARFVAELAREHNVEFVIDQEDVAAVARRQRLNLEDAARRLRYAFFQRIVEQGIANRIAVAHTADDQAETVLAHLFRGTGTSGLAGAYPIVGPVIRPLLHIHRKALRLHLTALGQSWREDSTNLDLTRQRARIRAELLPLIEEHFSPRIVNHLSELARFAREEKDFWNALVEYCFQTHVREQKGAFRVQISNLLLPLCLGSVASAPAQNIPPATALNQQALTERLVRRLYKGVKGDCRNLTAVHVQQVIHLASDALSGSRIELPGRILVERNFNELSVSRRSLRSSATAGIETDRAEHAYQYLLDIPEGGLAAISVPELKTRFSVKVIDWSSGERDTKQVDALDADLLRSPLLLRNWRPGDAYRPRGRRQVLKLKRLFLKQRVPRGERLRWPVIESGSSIVWARGMPPASDFCVGESTRAGVIIEESAL
jgi:tRNA(Ile)-lysidine synthase